MRVFSKAVNGVILKIINEENEKRKILILKNVIRGKVFLDEFSIYFTLHFVMHTSLSKSLNGMVFKRINNKKRKLKKKLLVRKNKISSGIKFSEGVSRYSTLHFIMYASVVRSYE